MIFSFETPICLELKNTTYQKDFFLVFVHEFKATRMRGFVVLQITIRRIRKSDYSLSLFSERYVKVFLHTAQAFHNPYQAAVIISIIAFVIPVCSLLTH